MINTYKIDRFFKGFKNIFLSIDELADFLSENILSTKTKFKKIFYDSKELFNFDYEIRNDENFRENYINNNNKNKNNNNKNNNNNGNNNNKDNIINETIFEKYSLTDLYNIIQEKNCNINYKKPINDLELKISNKLNLNIGSIDKIIDKCLTERISNKNFPKIFFDERLLDDKMKYYIKNNYINSNKSIKNLCEEFENTYGLHISSSTFSKYAKKYLYSENPEIIKISINSRKDLKKYYFRQSIT